jgi:hypothetical protein
MAHILANNGGKNASKMVEKWRKLSQIIIFVRICLDSFLDIFSFVYLRRYAGITVPYFRLWNVARCLLILRLSLWSWHLLGCPPPVRYFRRLDRPVGIVPEIRK